MDLDYNMLDEYDNNICYTAELVRNGAWRSNICRKYCIFNELCDNEKIIVDNLEYCYAEIAMNVNDYFKKSDYYLLPQKVIDKLLWDNGNPRVKIWQNSFSKRDGYGELMTPFEKWG